MYHVPYYGDVIYGESVSLTACPNSLPHYRTLQHHCPTNMSTANLASSLRHMYMYMHDCTYMHMCRYV